MLSGRRALVTGGSQGLGREIARAFLAASADVAICARNEADISHARAALAEEFPQRRVFALPCDIGKPEHLDNFYLATIETLGDLDIVVNNAGVHGPIGAIDKSDWDGWMAAIATNLLGTAYSCRLAIRHFKSRTRGWRAKIVNLSGGGATAPQPGLSAYGASKAGIVRLTETLAKEVEADLIDINAMAPGALATRLTKELLE